MSRSQMNLHALAENLGMTVRRLRQELTLSEYFGWMRYYAERERERNAPAEPQQPEGKPLTIATLGAMFGLPEPT